MKKKTQAVSLITSLALAFSSFVVPAFAEEAPAKPSSDEGTLRKEQEERMLKQALEQSAFMADAEADEQPFAGTVEYKGEVNEGITQYYRFQTTEEGTLNIEVKTGFDRLEYYVGTDCSGSDDCVGKFYHSGDTLPAGKYYLLVSEDFLGDPDPSDDYVKKPYHLAISGLTFAGQPDTELPKLNITSPSVQNPRMPLGTSGITFTGKTDAAHAHIGYMEDGYREISGSFSESFSKEEASYGGVYFYAYDDNGNMLNIDYHPLFPEFQRIGGKDRYEVAVNSNRAMFKAMDENFHEGFDPTGRPIVIASGTQFADALTAGSFAAKNGYAFFLTPTTGLTSHSLDRIKELKPNQAIIVGGTSSVSTHVEQQLRNLSIQVERVDGKDRFAVATGIASRYGTLKDTAIVTNGLVFSDAASVSGVAGRNGMPLLLTTADKLPDSVITFLKNHRNYKKFVIVGGTGSVSSQVASQLSAFGTVTRVDGKDRYEVSVNVAKHFGLEPKHFLLARGDVFTDALSGGPLAAWTMYAEASPLLLTTTQTMPEVVEKYLADHRDELHKGYILGGEDSVSPEIESKVKQLLSPQ